jgi:hypothetical protein
LRFKRIAILRRQRIERSASDVRWREARCRRGRAALPSGIGRGAVSERGATTTTALFR